MIYYSETLKDLDWVYRMDKRVIVKIESFLISIAG